MNTISSPVSQEIIMIVFLKLALLCIAAISSELAFLICLSYFLAFMLDTFLRCLVILVFLLMFKGEGGKSYWKFWVYG